MENSSVQLKRIRTKVERAAQDTSGASSRRETLQELIELTHSPSRQSKSYAAGQIPRFFNDFPDLEEEAINAIYDLCEDQDSKVRIDGYNAVTQVSYSQRKWVKRNADVLVQLLQSDEQEEVAVVKNALLKHLDMDPPVVLGVMCDQVVPPEEELEESERQMRERLRSLVMSFLATEALSAIVERYTEPPGSDAEQVLFAQEATMYSKFYLTEPGHYSKREVLVGADRRAASPAKLLRFYLSYLTGKMVLQKFSPENRVEVICWITGALSACEDEIASSQSGSDREQIRQLQRQAIDAASMLIEVLIDTKLYNTTLWGAVRSLLRATSARKRQDNWVVPSHLISVLGRFQALLVYGPQEDTAEIQNLIRSLTDDQSVSLTGTAQISQAKHDRLPEQRQRSKADPPPRKPGMTQHATRQSQMKDDVKNDAMAAPKRSSSSVEGTPEPKRARNNPKGQVTPSLLSRLAGADSTSTSTSELAKRKRGKQGPGGTSPELDKHPASGYSIKGAASAHRNGRSSESSGHTSLLGRLESLDTSVGAVSRGVKK
ncbi:hypothetical protein ID866_3701 [Astraeus odoratus]|nr:hypothetical protein ID866_3701 [Astraeus odoratus]